MRAACRFIRLLLLPLMGVALAEGFATESDRISLFLGVRGLVVWLQHVLLVSQHLVVMWLVRFRLSLCGGAFGRLRDVSGNVAGVLRLEFLGFACLGHRVILLGGTIIRFRCRFIG